MMDEIKQLSKQINVNQERLNKKIQEVFVELEELMQNADIKKNYCW